MASTFSYQSLRGFTLSRALASGAPRTASKVYFTSCDVKGLPSCHLTSLRRKKTRLRWLSCHDHFSASSGMIVSTLSCFFAGSKYTRLLKQGLACWVVATVDSSWTDRLGVALSGEVTSTPPYFGLWAVAPTTRSSSAVATPTKDSSGLSERGRVIVTSASATSWTPGRKCRAEYSPKRG